MSSIHLNLNAQLARTVAMTAKLKKQPRRIALTKYLFRGIDFVARGTFYLWRNRNYLTFFKLANMAAINIQCKLKTEKVIGRPYNMKIESTNICNTKCQLCPTGLGIQGRDKGKMSLSRYKSLINQLRRYLFGLDLSMWGDPLIVPDIYDMIRYAHDKGIWTYISSNLHAFKPDKGQAEQLIRSGLDMFTCSLHGASQATYELYQPGKNFEEALSKVRHIVATRDRLKSSTPVIQLNFVVTRHNEHERDAFQQLADELGCKAIFSTASMNLRFLNKDKKLQPLGLAPDLQKKKELDHLENWLPANQDYVIEPYRQLIESGQLNEGNYNGHKILNCEWPWKYSVINWDGTISTCCGSFEPDDDLGSVFDDSFAKLWNGEKYRMARRSFKHKITDKQAKGNPCANCPGFML